jgi:hypothetical protein
MEATDTREGTLEGSTENPRRDNTRRTDVPNPLRQTQTSADRLLSQLYWSDRIKEETDPERRKKLEELRARGMIMKGETMDAFKERRLSPEKRAVYERAKQAEEARKISDRKLEEKYHDLKLNPDTKFAAAVYATDRAVSFMSQEISVPKSAPAPGEVLQAEKHGKWEEENWTRFGWNDAEKRAVGNALKHLGKGLALDDKQVHIALQMLLATGKTPREILAVINGDGGTSLLDQLVEQQSSDDKNDHQVSILKKLESYHGKENALRIAYFSSLGINDSYICKFIYPKEFSEHNKQEFNGNFCPENAEDLGWQLSFDGQAECGLDSKFPTLEMRIITDKNGKVTGGKYYINEANIVRAIRKKMMFRIGEEPRDAHNYFERVSLVKSPIDFTLGHLINLEHMCLTSEDGKTFYRDLAYHIRIEAGITTFLRGLEQNYENSMINGDEAVKKLVELFMADPLTRRFFDKSAMNVLLIMPLDFEGLQSDCKLGAAWNEIQLAYYNLTDFDELQRILDPSFFKKDTFMQAIFNILHVKKEQSHDPEVVQFLSPEGNECFEKAFDARGNVKDKASFIQFINFYGRRSTDDNRMKVIREALKLSLLEKYDLVAYNNIVDTQSLDFIEILALCYSRISGAGARNDTTFTSDALAQAQRSGEFRDLMRDKLNPCGNPLTIEAIHSLMVPYAEAQSTNAAMKVFDAQGRQVGVRKMSALEVHKELHRIRSQQAVMLKKIRQQTTEELAGVTDPQERKRILARLKEAIIRIDEEYQKYAQKIEFDERGMSYYALEHVQRGYEVNKSMMGADEFPFDKFTERTMFGVNINRAEFQKGLLEGFKQLRFLLSRYNQLNFNQSVRAEVVIDKKGTKEYQDIPLALAMFGYDVLNRPKFWQLDARGKPVIDKKTGKHLIDCNKINTIEGKEELWKSVALYKLAMDFKSHRSIHTTDPDYDLNYYLNAIEILGTMFDKEDIAWFRQLSGATRHRLWGRAILTSIFTPHHHKGSGIGDLIAEFFRQIKSH